LHLIICDDAKLPHQSPLRGKARAIFVKHNPHHPHSNSLGEAASQNPADRLRVWTWCAVALVSGLLIFHQLLLLPTLMQLNTDAPVINVAGRQRMLSQKLAKTALALQVAKNSVSRQSRRGELEAVVAEWTRSHRGLQEGDSELHLPGKSSPAVRAAFANVEPHFQAILNAARELLAPEIDDPQLTDRQLNSIEQILEHEDSFLSQMHALVGIYATEARSHVRELQILGWVIVALILLLLFAAQWFVIRPAVDLIGSRFASSEDQYRRLVESMSEGVIVHDLRGYIQFANPRFCQIIGLSADELTEQLALSFIADVDRSHYFQMIETPLFQSEPVELALRRRDGRFTATMASIRPLTDERGITQGSLLVVTDITARKQAEQRSRELLEQLVHADRLKSMGELAASLAHEINQPLAAIVNYSEACLTSVSEAPAAAENLNFPLQKILSAAMRGGEIIRRVRRFSQRRPHEVRPEAVNDLVRDVEQLCRPEALKRDVQVELALSSDLPLLLIDGIQIQQVLTNLIQNAFHAMETTPAYRRRLRIATALLDEQFAVISVSDTGLGVTKQDSSQLFEPFFTTRPEGLGLGLAIARNIVEVHGGMIEVKRNPDAGATFQFTLPLNSATSVLSNKMPNEEPLHA
jgi:PAS domain S-box-containing protein